MGSQVTAYSSFWPSPQKSGVPDHDPLSLKLLLLTAKLVNNKTYQIQDLIMQEGADPGMHYRDMAR